MIRIQRTDTDNQQFQRLVSELDKYLSGVNGSSDSFYAQFNKIEYLKHVVIAQIENQTVGCGALKAFDGESMEVKRMYVLPEMRRKGVADSVLKELEIWSKELGYPKCILETSIKMQDAVSFYQKSSYSIIPNYGQYKDMESSVCFEKIL
jgi:GNAT superfamily N-acetyltransferase